MTRESGSMKRILLILLLVPFLFFGSLGAQESKDTEKPKTETVEKSESAASLVEQGGKTIFILIILSFFCIALVAFLLFTLRMEVLAPAQFIREAEAVAKTHDFEALKAVCKNSQSPAAKIIGVAATELDLNQNASYALIRDSIEDEGARQAGALWQRIQYLMDIGVVAPMIGLLGTVLGMREAFSGLAESMGTVKPIGLANGVGKALVTTAAGLVLGIAAMILYSFFRGRVNKLLSDLENRCSIVLRILVSKEGN